MECDSILSFGSERKMHCSADPLSSPKKKRRNHKISFNRADLLLHLHGVFIEIISIKPSNFRQQFLQNYPHSIHDQIQWRLFISSYARSYIYIRITYPKSFYCQIGNIFCIHRRKSDQIVYMRTLWQLHNFVVFFFVLVLCCISTCLHLTVYFLVNEHTMFTLCTVCCILSHMVACMLTTFHQSFEMLEI